MASDQPPASSSLPSDGEVFEFLFGHHKQSMYQLFEKFYTAMVNEFPPSSMEAIKKAVNNRDKERAINIIDHLFGIRASLSVNLHRLNAEIALQAATDYFRSLPKDLLSQDLKRGIASAFTAVDLDPLDIKNHYLLVSLLSMEARSPQERELVIEKCQEALKIDTQDPHGVGSKIINLLQHVRERDERIESIWEGLILGGNIKMSSHDLSEADIRSLQCVCKACNCSCVLRSEAGWMS